jgi:hypothetical protein
VDSVTLPHASRPAPPAPAALPETRAALDGFFRELGFTSEADLARLATWVLAPHGHRAAPRDALAVAHGRVELWLRAVLGPSPVGGALLTRGRAAFLLCDAARRGATVLTEDPESLPADFLQALRAAVPVPVPTPLPTVMPEQRLVLNPLAELLRRWWRAGQPDVSPSP